MCMWLSNFMRVFKAELGPERPSSWDPTRMDKHEAALTHSAPLHASVLDTCQIGRRGFDLQIDHVFKVIDNDTCCPKIRVIRAAKKPMTCSFTCVSPPKHWADGSEQACVWICYSLACQIKEVAVPQRDWFASELPAEVLLKLSCSWFKIHWCHWCNNPFGYRISLEYLENACHGGLWLC